MANARQSLFLFLVTFVVCANGMKKLWVDIVREVDDCTVKSKPGDVLHMEYIGKLENGTVFDSSFDNKQYYVFELGIGKVIKGWEEGLLDMCEGEQRYLIIPPDYGYGDEGAGGVIPANATLYMKVMLMKLESNKEGEDRGPEVSKGEL